MRLMIASAAEPQDPIGLPGFLAASDDFGSGWRRRASRQRSSRLAGARRTHSQGERVSANVVVAIGETSGANDVD